MIIVHHACCYRMLEVILYLQLIMKVVIEFYLSNIILLGRGPLENNLQYSSFSSTKPVGTGVEDPFVVLETASATVYSTSGLFTDPLEPIKTSESLKLDAPSARDGRIFDDINGLGGSRKSTSAFSLDLENMHKDKNPVEVTGDAPAAVASAKSHDNFLPSTYEVDNDQDSCQMLFSKSSKVSNSYKAVDQDGSPTGDANGSPFKTKTKTKASHRPEERSEIWGDIWLSVYEIPLFTQPTKVPAPSRPPPPSFRTRTSFASTYEDSSIDSNSRTKSEEPFPQQSSYPFRKPHKDTLSPSAVSSIDDLEDFAMRKCQDYAHEMPFGEEEVDTTSAAAASAAAMKEAMDKAEAKFKHAREAWEREKDFRSSKNRENVQRTRDKEEKEKGRLEREEEQKEKEDKAREQRRLEKMREMELEGEREKENARKAVERANREARERAAANSAPRERSSSHESAFETQFQNNGRPAGAHKTSGSSSSMRKPSSTVNIMDDLTTVFGTPSFVEFQEIEGEPEERRRARLEREQKTRERVENALAEKNEREMQMQRDQAERDRVSESLNTEIRRWAAGKEGNLRALLSTLQYVLWPSSGWQPVSLTDLITAASVKKVYRKATLCVHPDKVMSGSVQQKYIAEKVFDLLKEAWNKFNSEELF